MPHSSPRVSIVVLNWNGLSDTLACLESLSLLTYPNYNSVLIDNGSTDGSVVAVQARFPSVHCIGLETNRGFAGGNNVGINYALQADADYILLLNNDTVVAPDLLHRFVSAFQLHPEAGILGGRIYLFDKRDTLDHLGGMWDKKNATVHLVGLREKDTEAPLETCSPIDYACGACLAVKREVFATIGLLEPDYFLYWEENDFCLRARTAGFLTLTCPQAKIWHKVSASVTGGKPHATYFWWRGRLLWIKRNYSFFEKLCVYFRALIPDMLKRYYFHASKTVQLHLYKQSERSAIEHRLVNNRAALAGIRDYFLKRFDRGPSWIYSRKE